MGRSSTPIASFDPFLGTTYIDEAVGGRVSPFVGSSALLSPEERIDRRQH